MLISLYTSRVILDALGVEDYGIYNVVGGFVSMFALISAALTSACTRFLNFELGKGDPERQNIVFSTAVTIQWGLAIIVAILSEAIGVWYVNNVMVLPPERLTAANWCFQFSVFNFCMNLITVPYNASIIAHEKMKAFAYVSIFQGLAQLGISFMVYYEPFDRLVFYAFMLMCLQFLIRYMYQVYCRKHFEECHYRFVLDKPLLKHMFGYSLWHLVGNGASVLKNHGVNLVLNFFFGPAVNAACGLANHVDRSVNQFASNFMMAMNPQIGNVFAGSARNKETLEWLQNDIFGKVKQTTQSISINDERVSTSYNEKIDCLVPAAKIADMATGWICGQTARDFTPTEVAAMQRVNLEETDEFKTTKFFCKTNFDMRHIEEEKKHYTPLPKKYCFENEHEKEVMLSRNFRRINEEVTQLTARLLGKE